MHRDPKGRYGAPRVHAQLRTEQRLRSRKRVARLTRDQGLQSQVAKRWKRTTMVVFHLQSDQTTMVSLVAGTLGSPALPRVVRLTIAVEPAWKPQRIGVSALGSFAACSASWLNNSVAPK